jgi:hypothetical protein
MPAQAGIQSTQTAVSSRVVLPSPSGDYWIARFARAMTTKVFASYS